MKEITTNALAKQGCIGNLLIECELELVSTAFFFELELVYIAFLFRRL